MDCTTLANSLTDFLDGNLEPAAEAAALDHLATCSDCETVLAQTRTVISLSRHHGRVTLTSQERNALLYRILPVSLPTDQLPSDSSGRQ